MANVTTEMLNKVPIVTASFWIIKIMSTTVGETGADYLAVHVGLGIVVTDLMMATLLLAALLLQLRSTHMCPGDTGQPLSWSASSEPRSPML